MGQKNYTHSFKTWKLNPNCISDGFLTGCYLWQLLNTVEDLPMQGNEKIEIEKDKRELRIL